MKPLLYSLIFRFLHNGRKTYLTLLTVLALVCQSCTGDFLKESSQDLARVTSVNDLKELLVGDCLMPLQYMIKRSSMFAYSSAENYLILHFMGDELQETINTPLDPDISNTTEKYFPYFTWQKNCNVDYKGNKSLDNAEALYWELAYRKINNCNMVIHEAENIAVNNEEEERQRNHIVGECHFLRAMYYFMLINLYARPYDPTTAASTPGVPLKTSYYIEDKAFDRDNVANGYARIVADLQQAETLLKDVTSPESLYHAGITAVYLLHSRVALYMQNWDEAQRYALLAIKSNGHLADNTFLEQAEFPINETNPEVIYSNGSSCFGNVIYYSPGSSWISYSQSAAPAYCVDQHLVQLYDDADIRKTAYITNKADVNYGNWTYKKIDNKESSFGSYKPVSDIFSLRMAEAYINAAEAMAHTNQAAEACKYIDMLRQKRIKDAAGTHLQGAPLVTFIREERERELCFEGHRWFDLRRYSVDKQFPYTKTIEHTMSYYTLKDGSDTRTKTDYYRLESNDAAYTLNIPQKVRDFQNTIGGNERPDRLPFDSKIFNPDEATSSE